MRARLSASVCTRFASAPSQRAAQRRPLSSHTRRPRRRAAAAFSTRGDDAPSDGSSSSAAPAAPAAPATADADSAAAAFPSASPRRDLLMLFTCGRCDMRAAKAMSRQSYEHGVVLVRCDGCGATHVIADRKGWFGEPGSVEDFLVRRHPYESAHSVYRPVSRRDRAAQAARAA